MSRDKRQFLRIFVGAFLLTMPMSGCSANKMLSRRFDHFWPYKNEEFRTLCGALDVPCGIERLPGDIAHTDYKTRFKADDVTAREILDAIVEQRPGYYWEVRHGVINILPKVYQRGEPGVLDRKIKIGTIKETPIDSAVWLIVGLSGLHCSPSILGIRSLSNRWKSPRLFNLKFRNVTLRDALNKAAKAHGRMKWSIRPTDDARQVVCNTETWKKPKKVDPAEEKKFFELYIKDDPQP